MLTSLVKLKQHSMPKGNSLVLLVLLMLLVCIRAPEHEPDAYINRKKCHSLNLQALPAVRQKVERSFSLLKGRWQKLQYLDHLDLVMAVKIITATCVLHNFCLLYDDFDDGYFLPGHADGIEDGGSEQREPPDHGAAQKK
ncbi:unnamed protein product, partial [Pocillopora meandrina]